MQTVPHVEILNKPDRQKALIALMEPDIHRSGYSAQFPYIRIEEEDVLIIIEFPNEECMNRFAEMVGTL